MTVTAARPSAPPPAETRRRPNAVPGWGRDAIGVVTWTNVLIVVALWVADGQTQALGGGWGSALDSLGRLTGLVASDLLLIQVLLMARLPLVERVYGQDELARRHRLVGFTSFTLMLVHITLMTLGYSFDEGRNPVAELWDLVVTYPGMLIGLVGSLLIVMVALTSIRRARARLRYESWHLLHLYAYLGAGLALPHQLWTGQEFLTHGVATVYWWSLWIAAAGAVVVWRIAVPIGRSLYHDLRVTAVVRESPDAVSVWMRGRHLDRLPVTAGQFLTWRFLSGPGWTRGNPYSLSAPPDGDRLRITVKDLGDGSHATAGLRPGTRVLIEGPFGRLHSGVRTRRKVTLLAGGIGVTPLRALLQELTTAPDHRPGDITLIYRARDERALVFQREIDRLAAESGARVFYVLGARVPGRDSWLPDTAAHVDDTEALTQLVPDIADQDVYLCGAGGWMDAARTAVLAAGAPAAHVHLERFSW